MSLDAKPVSYCDLRKLRVWALLARELPKLVWKMSSPSNFSSIVSTLARFHRRDQRQLMLLARLLRKCIMGDLFGPELSFATVKTFAKLDVNRSRRNKGAMFMSLNQALDLGPTY